MSSILLKNATILTINPYKDIFYNTDILIEENLISKIAPDINITADTVIDCANKIIMPGFIQTHIHLCQTLFRGLAENLPLLEWLSKKIWPLEACHNEKSMYYSALLGIGELLTGGTTTILDMGSVKHTDQIFLAIAETGIRATAGKAMMDCGEYVPENLLETTQCSIEDSMNLYRKWNNAENSRIKYAFAPRFILSVSDDLLRETAKLASQHAIPVHTHAYENCDEGKKVFDLKGMREFDYFEKLGLLDNRFLAAHCVWTDKKDFELIKKYDIKVLHCPSSNFKLGSGMMNLAKFLDNGVNVSIGADGAACSNTLDMLQELRTTALMQNVINNPCCIDTYKYLELATIEGARALGLENETGSLEIGKKADLIVIDLERDFSAFHAQNVDIATKIIYSANKNCIETVIIDGKIIIENYVPKTINKKYVFENCRKSIVDVLKNMENFKIKG
jgi:5-methylthioadenosine/S-adenosylhomocysteine deaminase